MLKALFGLIGEKLGHSISPYIHGQIFEKTGIEGCYHLFEVPKGLLKDTVRGLTALNIRGVNVTIPYKVSIMEHLDEISTEALKIGAVNTICIDGKRTVGYNTDYHGFGMTLDKYGILIKDRKAVVLGSGGAARSVCQYLKDHGIGDIAIVSRDINKVEPDGSFKDINIISYGQIEDLKGYDVIVNCTPCGMYPNIGHSPVTMEVLGKFSAAIDLIYNPSETQFLKYARKAGIKGVNGLYMLVEQAVASEELWNGIKISKNITDSIYEPLNLGILKSVASKYTS